MSEGRTSMLADAKAVGAGPADRAANGERVFPSSETSSIRAWLALVWFCIQRQARARQMVWIALALLGFTSTLIALNTAADRWGMWHWRWRWMEPPPAAQSPTTWAPPSRFVIHTYRQTLDGMHMLPAVQAWPPEASAIQLGTAGCFEAVIERSDFYVFSNWIVFSIFLSFLLPIWSLSFATEALGSEREGRTLVWLHTRPLPRSSIYLAKFIALLPWGLGLNLGGLALMCLLAGKPGLLALDLYWPAILWASLAFCSLFHLLSACFRRAAVVALIYSFFLEVILGNMPGMMKRISIGFYTRCMMFEAAQGTGVQPVKASVFVPVSGTVAWCVLMSATVGFLLLGTWVFARSEYQDLN